jgi:molybdopterin/thiamine biosynthesis adenylyltransferase
MTDNTNEEMFSRNVGLVSEVEQDVLKNSTVAIAGVGADGGLLAERLVRTGVGNLHLADPDTFDVSNLNRQFGCDNETVGRNKAEVIAEIAKKINPTVNVQTYPGVSAENIVEFISSADVVVDEIDYTRLDISVMLHREARTQGKYVLLGVNIGWGANIFVFAPDGMTLEEYVGLPKEVSNEDIRKFVIPPEKFAPQVPEYMGADLIDKIIHSKISIPSVSPSVALEAAMLSTALVLYLTRGEISNIIPGYSSIDLLSKRATL